MSKKSRPADLSESALAARDLLELFTLRDDHGENARRPAHGAGHPRLLLLRLGRDGGAPKTRCAGSATPTPGSSPAPGRWNTPSRACSQKPSAMRCDEPTYRAFPAVHSLEAIAQAVNDAYGDRAAAGQGVSSRDPTGIPPFFPNPGHHARLAGLTVADQQHWLSRVRGGPDETTAGSTLARPVACAPLSASPSG